MFTGLTRKERWVLVVLVVVIGAGLGANQLREARHRRVFELVEGKKPRELTHIPPPPQDPPARSVPGEGDKININTASASKLQRLKGIGEKKAEAIVEERTAGGPFRSIEDLERVKGIGSVTVEKLRPFITVDGGNQAGAPGSGSASAGQSGSGVEGADSPSSSTTNASPSGSIPPLVKAPLGPGSGRLAPPKPSNWNVQSPIANGGAGASPGRYGSSPVAPTPPPAPPPSMAPNTTGGRININTAGFEELKRLHGIGDVLARRVLAYRTAYGPFRRVEDLMKVKGIGVKTLEKNRELIRVN